MYNVSFPGLGIELTVNPVAFSIGDFKVYWYGIIIGIGFALAVLFAMRNNKRFGVKRDGLIDCIIVGLICGIIGARLFYVIFRWNDYYAEHPGEIFAIHSGGLAIYGGVIGGLLGGGIVARVKKLPLLAILDLAVMGFLIGQGVGRWGNFFNQEAFGTPTDLPWRMVSENTDGVGVHPCFLYESLWCLLGFVLLYVFSRKWRKYDGQIFLMYLVWYGFERMIVEGLRTDSLYTPFFGLRVSQIIAAVTMTAGIVLLIVFRKRTYRAADHIDFAAAGALTDEKTKAQNGADEAVKIEDTGSEKPVSPQDEGTEGDEELTPTEDDITGSEDPEKTEEINSPD